MNHTQAAVPFISDTGVIPPENGIFTIVMVCTAIQFILISTIRFKQIWDNTEKKSCYNITIHITNIIAYCISYIAGFGLILVGSYTSQDDIVAHYLGGFLNALLSILYFMLQTGLSFAVEPKLKLRWVVLSMRIVMLLFSLTMFVLYLAYFGIDIVSRQNSVLNTDNPFKVISPVAEWLLLSVVNVLFLTLIPELHALDVHFRVLIRDRGESNNEVSSLVTVNEVVKTAVL